MTITFKRTFIFIFISLLGLSSCQKEKEVVVQKEETLTIASQGSGGGVIDGGGSDQEYTTREFFDFTLKQVYRNLKSRNHYENILLLANSKRMVDFEPGNHVYQNQKPLLDEVGNFFDIITQDFHRFAYFNRKNCEIMGIEKFLEKNTYYRYDLRGSTCGEIFPIQNIPLTTILEFEDIEVKNQCFDHYGNERIASVSNFTITAKICLSWSKFSQLHKADLELNLMKIIVHELVHKMGVKEEVFAIAVENYIVDNYSRLKDESEEYKSQHARARSEIIRFIHEKDVYIASLLENMSDLFDISFEEVKEIKARIEEGTTYQQGDDIDEFIGTKIKVLFNTDTENSFEALKSSIMSLDSFFDDNFDNFKRSIFIENLQVTKAHLEEVLAHMRDQKLEGPPLDLQKDLEKYAPNYSKINKDEWGGL